MGHWMLGIVGAAGLGLFSEGSYAADFFPGKSEVQNVRPHETHELRLGRDRVRFDPGREEDLGRLANQIETALAMKDGPILAPQFSSATKKVRRGLEELKRLVAELRKPAPTRAQAVVKRDLLEVVEAINNSQRLPLPEHIDVITTPWVFFSHVHRPVGKGRLPAVNLERKPEESGDLSRLDPVPSTFWRKPAAIPTEDLYHGFGRKLWEPIESKTCEYEGPKESFGMNSGFEVNCEGETLKLKFAEVSCEPFVARIFAALGYNVDPTDYSPMVKVRYDRRIFQEFNSRQPMRTRFTLLGVIPIYTANLQKHFDPFDYIAWAVTRDGKRWSGRELKERLLLNVHRRHPEMDPANFRDEIESEVDFLITTPANVQNKSKRGKSIGPWDFGQLDHADRRELRGVGLLAAWLGWFDTRFDNTRVRTVKRNDAEEVRHFISDLGGGLGETSGLLVWRGERPNAFPWTFTRPPIWRGAHQMADPLRISGYKPLAPTEAFAAMTIDDARWMARLIAQLSESQIIDALVAAGYDSAAVKLYTEKLIGRRDRMMIDLGLGGEIPLVRPAGVNRRFSYDPASADPVKVTVAGSDVQAVPSSRRIVDGKLLRPNGHPTR